MKAALHKTLWWILSLLMCGALGCSEISGVPIDAASLGYQECLTNDDCAPHGSCNGEGYCDSQCRNTADCVLLLGAGVEAVCVDHQCLLEGDLPDEQERDGFSQEGDGGCDPTIDEELCSYRPADECLEMGWQPFCSDVDCAGRGWRYVCHEGGFCEDRCEVDLGTPASGSPLDDYTGVWAGIFTLAVRNNGVPLVGYQDTVTINYCLIRIWADQGRLAITEKICHLSVNNFKEDELLPNDLVVLVIPEAYTDSVSLVHHIIEDPPLMEEGATFVTDRFWEGRALKLEDLVHDPLPTRADYEAGDPRIWDQDGDGNPAMTSIVSGILNGEVYSVQRWSSQYMGEVITRDRLQGLVDQTNETINVAGTSDILLSELETVSHPEEDRSYFRMERVDEGFTCDDVMALAESEEGWIHFSHHLEAGE